MKKKLKKSLACLLATLLIFSAVPMSALADEADTPVSVTVETNAEKAAQDTEPYAEPMGIFFSQILVIVTTNQINI